MRALTLGSREGRTNESTFGTEKLKLSTLVYTTNFVGKVFSARTFFWAAAMQNKMLSYDQEKGGQKTPCSALPHHCGKAL